MSVSLSRMRLYLMAGATLAILSACGGSPSPATSAATATATIAPSPTPIPTPDVAAIGTQFIALLGSVNPAYKTMNTYLFADQGQTPDQIQKHTSLFVAVLRKFDAGLLAIAWPSQAIGDAHALVTADGAFEGVLDSAAVMTSYDGWVSRGQSALDAARSAAAILRSDLRLPARVAGQSIF